MAVDRPLYPHVLRALYIESVPECLTSGLSEYQTTFLVLFQIQIMRLKYFYSFYQGQQHLLKQRLTITITHFSNYRKLENMLGFQYYLSKLLFGQASKKIMHENKKEFIVHRLFYRNLQSLQSSLYAVERDLLHPAATNLRTVHEAIPKMYYIALYPKDIEEIMAHEVVHGEKYEKANDMLREKAVKHYLGGIDLQFSTSREFAEFKTKYSPNGFRNALYDEKRKKAIRDLYHHFSISVHPNLMRDETTKKYDRFTTQTFFEFMQGLSYFNIGAHLEGTFDLLHKFDLADKPKKFLEKMRKSENLGMYEYFTPNKENLPKLKSLSET